MSSGCLRGKLLALRIILLLEQILALVFEVDFLISSEFWPTWTRLVEGRGGTSLLYTVQTLALSKEWTRAAKHPGSQGQPQTLDLTFNTNFLEKTQYELEKDKIYLMNSQDSQNLRATFHLFPL